MPVPPPSLGMSGGAPRGAGAPAPSAPHPAQTAGLLGPTSPQITQQQIQEQAITKALATIQQQTQLAKDFAKQFPEAAKPIQLVISGWQQALTQIISSQRPQAGGAPTPPI